MNFCSSWSEKEVLNTLSDFALKILSLHSLTVFFHIVKDLFKSNEGLLRSWKVQIGSKGERIFVLAGLRKKYLTRCQIFAQNTIFTQFNK